MSTQKSLTFYLFALPSFEEGYARIIDLSGALSLYNKSYSAGEADFTALKADWMMVGRDIKEGIKNYEQSTLARAGG